MEDIGDFSETNGEITIEWRIKDFSSLPQEIDKHHDRPKFYFSGTSWLISLYPNGETEHKSNGWLSLFVLRISSGPPVTLDFSLCLKSTNGKNDILLTVKGDFHEKNKGWGNSKIILKTDLMQKKTELLPSDILTIVCSLKNKGRSDVVQSYFQRLQDVSDNLKEIYQKGKKTDFTLKVGDENILAHRIILETRCPVFGAMLNHGTQENQTGEVSIEDLDKNAVKSLLIYIYTGDIDDLTTENALSIYAAANKYDIKKVKAVCVKFIMRNLSVKWVCDVIQFADLYDEKEVGRRAREYFTENVDEILDSDNWKSFIKENPLLGVELLSSIVKHTLSKTKRDK